MHHTRSRVERWKHGRGGRMIKYCKRKLNYINRKLNDNYELTGGVERLGQRQLDGGRGGRSGGGRV